MRVLYFDGYYEIVEFYGDCRKPYTVSNKGKSIFKHFDKFRKAKKFLKKVLNEAVY